MEEVNIRELRNHGGEVVDRVAAGEVLIVTRSGKPVAELRPVTAPVLAAEVVIRRRRHLPAVDPYLLHADVDRILDASL